MSKIGFVSLGCPKNLLDTEVMLGHVVKAGYEITPEDTEADIIIINTCSFINDAKKESIDNILDIAWLKENANLKGIIVTGCLAQRYRDEILKEFPEVDAVLGTGSVHSIVDAIKAVEKKRKFSEFKDENEVALGGDRVVTTTENAFAYLKISEGCNNRCTYCAIPNIRGKFRSRPMDEIISEAKELVQMGVSEIVVIGQDTTAYGIDIYGEYRLHELLSRLEKETDVKWLRILYCYPDKITPELINEFKVNKKLVKYIDIPIQHINDRILKRMNRRGDGALIKKVIKDLRQIDDMVIRSTAIVGFPGETEEEFMELLEYIKEAKFERFGAFSYSREEDTPAYNFNDQIDDEIKEKRLEIIMRESNEIFENYNQEQIGKEKTVIVEGYDRIEKVYIARSQSEAPEIDDIKLLFTSKERHVPGDFVKVKIQDVDDFGFLAKEV
ncbi:MAG: 30S ribosomal protein S12 methylthiotransferase RimO [Clostridia bacterium]|nr:30S ribosomal protein S12 methylthiotransferase RimO [Clostridia bacterium]